MNKNYPREFLSLVALNADGSLSIASGVGKYEIDPKTNDIEIDSQGYPRKIVDNIEVRISRGKGSDIQKKIGVFPDSMLAAVVILERCEHFNTRPIMLDTSIWSVSRKRRFSPVSLSFKTITCSVAFGPIVSVFEEYSLLSLRSVINSPFLSA